MCDPTYRKANEASLSLSTLPPWLMGIIKTRVAEATQHIQTAPTLKQLWDFLGHRLNEYDPSRANGRWRALSPLVDRGQVSLIDLEEFYTRWQRLLPLSNETRPHVIRERLLSKLPWIKEKVVKKEAKNRQRSCVVDFGALDPSPGPYPFEKELRKYCAERCTTVPEFVSYAGPGVIVDCKDPDLQEWVLKLNNTPHKNGQTLKLEQRRPRLKPEDIYALAYKDVSKREALHCLRRRGKTTVAYTCRPPPLITTMNAVIANATAKPNTAQPTDNSVNALGHPKPRAKQDANPGSEPPPSNHPVWVWCSKQ